MQHIIAEDQTEGAYTAHAEAPRVKPDQSDRQRHRDWRQELLRAVWYCSMAAPVPFPPLDPHDPEDFR